MDDCIRQVAALSAWIMGYYTGDYTFVLARLGPLHLGCNREVAALLRWLLTQVSLYIHEYYRVHAYMTSLYIGCIQ